MEPRKGQASPVLIRNLVILACAVDAADRQLLPATFKAIDSQLHLGPAGLATLNFSQSIAFSLALPVWGSMMRYYSAQALMVYGCLLWGVTTLFIAMTSSWHMQVMLRFVVGAALASVNPLGQAIICDVVEESRRGDAFGLLQAVSSGLSMLVSFGATATASEVFLGIYGWRWAHVVVALFSIAAGCTLRSVGDSGAPPPLSDKEGSWFDEQRRVLRAVGSKPTFYMMVAQGVTGGVPWNAFAFLTFYFQLSGYTDMQAGQLMLVGGVAGIAGAIIGGKLGDFCSSPAVSPTYGRCMVAQSSVVLGIIFFLWMIHIPFGPNSFSLLAIASVLFYMTAGWTPAAALRPMCGELFVNPQDASASSTSPPLQPRPAAASGEEAAKPGAAAVGALGGVLRVEAPEFVPAAGTAAGSATAATAARSRCEAAAGAGRWAQRGALHAPFGGSDPYTVPLMQLGPVKSLFPAAPPPLPADLASLSHCLLPLGQGVLLPPPLILPLDFAPPAMRFNTLLPGAAPSLPRWHRPQPQPQSQPQARPSSSMPGALGMMGPRRVPERSPLALRPASPQPKASRVAAACGQRRLQAGRLADEEAVTAALAALTRALDREFEPFALQHNKRLLLLFEGLLGAEGRARPSWPPELLQRVTFKLQDLAELGAAVAGPLARLPTAVLDRLGDRLRPRYLRWQGGGRWRLEAPPEVRRHLSSAKLGAPAAAGGDVTVLSQAAARPFEDGTPEGRQRSLRFGTQLRALRADVVCLQGIDPDAACRALGFTHKVAIAASRDDACSSAKASTAAPCRAAVLWDTRRWTLVAECQHHCGVAVELCRAEEPSRRARFVSMSPSVADCSAGVDSLGPLLNGAGSSGDEAAGAVVVCADLGPLGGGAEAAPLVPGLEGLRAVLPEVLAPRRRLASHVLRPTWAPSVVFSHGLTAVSALGSHTEGYLATMPDGDLEQQIPAGRPPLHISFSWDCCS